MSRTIMEFTQATGSLLKQTQYVLTTLNAGVNYDDHDLPEDEAADVEFIDQLKTALSAYLLMMTIPYNNCIDRHPDHPEFRQQDPPPWGQPGC